MTIEKIRQALEAVNCSPEAIEWAVKEITDRDNGWKFKRKVGTLIWNLVWSFSPNFAPDVYESPVDYWRDAIIELRRRNL